jgi:hypothetical protein
MCQQGATGSLAHMNMCRCHTRRSPVLVGLHVLAQKGCHEMDPPLYLLYVSTSLLWWQVVAGL